MAVIMSERMSGICWCSTYFHFSQVRFGKSWLGIFKSWACNSISLNLWLQRITFWSVKDLKYPRFYGIMVTIKKSTSGGACGSCEVVENMEFGFRPQSWPYTVPDYVETVLERAHESSDFRLKSIKNHSKTLILQGILRLGRRCRRFESCHSDQFRYS